MAKKRPALLLAVAAAAPLYLFAVWLHFPYGGGHVYSDLVTVFQDRLGGVYFSPHVLPYVNAFIEYPPLTAYFIYAMAVLGSYLPLAPGAGVIDNYYLYTALFLSVPTLLMIPELLKLCDLLGVRRASRRTLLFYVATPSFLIMVLLNWYVIGVYLAALALRKYLQGSLRASGLLFGVSAGFNLVTAAPAFGLLVAARGRRERLQFALAVVGAYALINLPFITASPRLWSYFWQWQENWYIEGSWMLAFLNNESPLRHLTFPAVFASLSAAILWRWSKDKHRAQTPFDESVLTVRLAALFTLAYLFSTYVFTPQLNLMLLPFFVLALLPAGGRYWEFLAFELVNALVVLWGFSAPLLVFGISLPTPVLFGSVWVSPIQALAVLRSLWVAKLFLYDGLLRPESGSATALAAPVTSPLWNVYGWTLPPPDRGAEAIPAHGG